jgi:hypothetical protein
LVIEFSPPHNGLLYEINTMAWLHSLRQKTGGEMTLSTVPDQVWREYRSMGFNLLWLMGVWQRSPRARQIALQNKYLQAEYEHVLPGWTADDIAGSPYAVYSYTLDSSLGRSGELALLKQKLNGMGMGMILDFVPNHLALDHAWTLSHPHRFVQATAEELAQHPERFFRTPGGAWLAHGRDPNFPPWQDTVQVNFFSQDLREALIKQLLGIAQACDGVRCDMAMLGLNSVYQMVWGKCIHFLPETQSEFWSEAIGRVRAKYPGFIFIAESYWGTEAELRQLGFDYTYDKRLYDRLRYVPAPEIGEYIREARPSIEHSLLFVENHDEPRALSAFGEEKSLAAATIICTLPGMRLLHGGQLEGLVQRVPVQMGRLAEEETNLRVKGYYEKLLPACRSLTMLQGSWALLEAGPAWDGDMTFHRLLAWCWQYQDSFKLVAVNYSNARAYGRIRLPLALENAQRLVSDDVLHGRVYSSPAAEVREQGLYIELPPWGSHLLDVKVDQGK